MVPDKSFFKYSVPKPNFHRMSKIGLICLGNFAKMVRIFGEMKLETTSVGRNKQKSYFPQFLKNVETTSKI